MEEKRMDQLNILAIRNNSEAIKAINNKTTGSTLGISKSSLSNRIVSSNTSSNPFTRRTNGKNLKSDTNIKMKSLKRLNRETLRNMTIK